MIYLHVGLPKTGTTFLQQMVFGCWPNLTYCNDLWFPYLVLQEQNKKYLVSNETLSGRPWNRDPQQGFSWHDETEQILDGLTRLYPDASILISFRRHASFVESLYAQYLHEGGTRPLEQFFSLDAGDSIISARDLNYTELVELAESRFGGRVFVFTLDQIREDLERLLADMGDFFGEAPPKIAALDLSYRNRSVGHYQAKVLRRLNGIDRKPGTRLKPHGRMRLTNAWTKALGIDPRSLCQNRLSWISSRKIELPQDVRENVDAFFSEDWRIIKNRAIRHVR